MKKLLMVTALLFISCRVSCQVFLSGQIKNAPDSSEINITYYNNSFEFIELSLGKVKPDKQGKFTLTIQLENPTVAKLNIAEQYTEMYLVPNDSLYISTDYNTFDSSLVYSGRGAADNTYMAAEMKANFNMQAQMHRRFDDADKFAMFEDSLEKANNEFLKAHDSPEFTQAFRNYITATTKYRFIYPRWMYKNAYNQMTNTFYEKPVPDNYYDFLKAINPNDEQAADNGSYEGALGNYLYEFHEVTIYQDIPESLPESAKTKMRITKGYDLRKQLFRDRILDYQLTEFMNRNIVYAMPDAKFAEDLMKDYKATCKNQSYIAIIDKIYAQANKLVKGNPAPDFTLMDIGGKQVAVSSFKGKIVYIDFWATWCVPCLAEMPRSHELMEKLKNKKDVVFLYVNVRDDMDNWKQYIAKEKLKGIILFANDEQTAELFKIYNFKGIPHYVLIDKNGNLISADAERPGSVEKDILEALKLSVLNPKR